MKSTSIVALIKNSVIGGRNAHVSVCKKEHAMLINGDTRILPDRRTGGDIGVLVLDHKCIVSIKLIGSKCAGGCVVKRVSWNGGRTNNGQEVDEKSKGEPDESEHGVRMRQRRSEMGNCCEDGTSGEEVACGESRWSENKG